MASEQLAIPGSEQFVRQPVTPMELLGRALAENVDTEKLSKLMELQERWEQNEARRAFVAALNAFKANPPVIEKVKKVDFSSRGGNRVNYNYAPLDYVTKLLGEALSKHNLSFRWDVRQADGKISVTCVLQHSQGHSESVTLTAGLHDDERMNAIQRLGSTVTYLERYTLLAATGMATEEQDDDGAGMDNGQLGAAVDEILKAADDKELDDAFRKHYKAANGHQKAQKVLVDAKDKRRRELHPAPDVQGVPLNFRGKK